METEYIEACSDFLDLNDLDEIVCFQYQRMMRYGGGWHLERRTLLPGYIFLSVKKEPDLMKGEYKDYGRAGGGISLIPCGFPYLKKMCREENLIGMSKGVIRDGNAVITKGPLKGRERLIRKIDRHKRIAEIEIPIGSDKKRVAVGLEIYKKQV